MTFYPESVADFLELFEASKFHIRNFDGCKHLQLLKESEKENIFFTYSIWDSEEHLEKYRNSELFKSVWSKTKILFQASPQAWSLDNILTLP